MKLTNSLENRQLNRKYDKYIEGVKKRAAGQEVGIINPEILELYDRIKTSGNIVNVNAQVSIMNTLEKISKESGIPLYNQEFISLTENCPKAAILHLAVQTLILGILMNKTESIIYAKKTIKSEMYALCHPSAYNDTWLNAENIGFFVGACASLEASLAMQSKESLPRLIGILNQHGLDTFIPHFIDAVTITKNIVEKRVIYRSDNFAITYGRTSILEFKKIKYGELFISVLNGDGIWSMDKHSDIRISITDLRQARKAVNEWRGVQLVGEITHEEAARISKFLGLSTIADPERTMMGIVRKSKGFSP